MQKKNEGVDLNSPPKCVERSQNVWKFAFSFKLSCSFTLANKFMLMHEKINIKRNTMQPIFTSAGRENNSVLKVQKTLLRTY